MSAVAGLLSFVNPLLAGIIVSRAVTAFKVPYIAPILIGLLIVNGLRMILRGTVAGLMHGRRRSPIIRIQHKIGKWLWWIDPTLHRWGVAGWLVKRLGIATNAAALIIYTATDTFVTILAGVIFYLTRSYALSMLAALLPALEAAPWFAQKTMRFKRVRKSRLRYSK